MTDEEKELAALKKQLTTLQGEVSTLTKERDKLSGKLTSFEAQAGTHKTMLETVTRERDEHKAQFSTVAQERDSLKAEADAAKASLETLTPTFELHKKALSGLHRSTLLKGIIDPDIVALAPTVELSTDGLPTDESVEKVREWRAAKSHLFPEPIPTATGTQTPAPPLAVVPAPQVNTPVVDAAGNQLSWEYWDKLRDSNAAVYQERQPEYIAWCLAQENAQSQK